MEEEEAPPSKSSKDKKANGPDAKAPSLAFKLTSRVQYKTVLKGSPVLFSFLGTDFSFKIHLLTD